MLSLCGGMGRDRDEGDTGRVGLHVYACVCSQLHSVQGDRLVLVSREWSGFCHIWHIITQPLWQSARTDPFLSLSFCPAPFLCGTVPVVV